MGVRIETEHGVYVEISDSVARSILEQVHSLGEDFHELDDEEITAAAGDMVDRLMRVV